MTNPIELWQLYTDDPMELATLLMDMLMMTDLTDPAIRRHILHLATTPRRWPDGSRITHIAMDLVVKHYDPTCLATLLHTLQAGEAEMRGIAAVGLGKIKDRRAVEPLMAALSDDDDTLRANAAWALGELKESRAVEPILMLLKDEWSYPRQQAAVALGKIGGPQAVDGLIAALAHPDMHVRAAAIESLGRIGDRRAVAPLIEKLADTERLFRPFVAKRTQRRVCDVVLEALDRIGTPEAFAAIEAWHRKIGHI